MGGTMEDYEVLDTDLLDLASGAPDHWRPGASDIEMVRRHPEDSPRWRARISRLEQGLPVVIEDPAVLDRIAGILRPPVVRPPR
jgi:hypothetical protein